MVEKHRSNSDWGYLIKPDKSASPNLEQLCLGLAQIICGLETGPVDRLTPRRLATFYKSVGGDLDALFLRTSESGLSFLYRTIGCFHSLEPSPNPFETPSIPCLTPDGFVKWQTVQILLCPEEHVRYLQEAVRIYDVPRPDGGVFPKTMPRASFPEKADAEMEQWHRQVTAQLNQENYMRARIKSSPYHSPHPQERPDGYFSPPVPKIHRPSRPSRQSSRDDIPPHSHSSSRRRSEPEWANPPNSADRPPNSYVYVRDGGRRSASANRPNTAPIAAARQRAATTASPTQALRPPYPSPRTSDRPPSAFHQGRYIDRVERNPRERSHSQSSHGETSADDASSEDSGGQRQSRGSKVASSFLSVLPFTTPWNKRSRSHDTSYRKDRRSPRRDERDASPPLRASTENFQRPSVRFRQDIFDNQAAASAPESPAYDKRPHSGHSGHSGHSSTSGQRPDHRYQRNPGGAGLTDPAPSVGYNLTREQSNGSGSDHRTPYDINGRQFKRSGPPQRSNTMTGVQARKHASAEQNRDENLPPVTQNGATQPNAREPLRYSLAV